MDPCEITVPYRDGYRSVPLIPVPFVVVFQPRVHILLSRHLRVGSGWRWAFRGRPVIRSMLGDFVVTHFSASPSLQRPFYEVISCGYVKVDFLLWITDDTSVVSLVYCTCFSNRRFLPRLSSVFGKFIPYRCFLSMSLYRVWVVISNPDELPLASPRQTTVLIRFRERFMNIFTMLFLYQAILPNSYTHNNNSWCILF